MAIPGAIYDVSVSPMALVAAVRLSLQRRAEPTVARHKNDDGWEELSPGPRTISLKVRATGITSPAWMETLIERWRTHTIASYLVALDAGDAHSGAFLIEGLDEDLDSEDRRRFSLTLRSSGPVTYTPAA